MKVLLSIFLCLVLISCTENQPAVNKADSETIQVSTESEITCPYCGYTKMETLPTEYCLFKYTCESCGKTITPKDGDCCVFCSYGTHECPSIQEENL